MNNGNNNDYDEYEEEMNQKDMQANFKSQSEYYNNPNKRISIPIDSAKLKDKDHINLDINLRLVDFLPNQNNSNRSVDDFDVNNDPLARYIRQYETNISRSLPGSSGSLNKHKPLPPLNRRAGKQLSQHEARLQNEHDNEAKSEGILDSHRFSHDVKFF